MMKKPKKSILLLGSFLLPALLVTAVMALCGICPFGSRSLSVLDMSNQFLAFLGSLRYIVTGRASLLYLPSMALGGNMIGVMAYYLMSPLNLLTCLFPLEDLILSVSLLFILRVGLCGLTMGIYAGARHGWSWRVLFAAAAYGLTAYMLVYCTNYIWQDDVILLPIVALGIARLVRERKVWTYVLALAAAIVLNFYTGFILCLFSVLFFLAELLAAKDRALRPLRCCGVFALASLAAGALAAFALVPTALCLMGSKANVAQDAFTLAPKFEFPALFSKLFMGAFNYDELTPVGLPNIFCGSVTLALAVLYFANGSIPRRRRLLTGCLLAVITVSFYISALDLIWHGMNVPTWENYRYSFLFSFLLIAAADGALASLREDTRTWHLLLPPAVTALLGVLAFAGRSYSFISWHAALEGVAAAALTSGALFLLRRPGVSRRLAAVLAAGLLLIHAADLGANGQITLSEQTATSSDPAAWAAYTAEKGQAMAMADTGDAFIRVESPDSFDMDRCEPMLFDYDGLTHYSSTIPQQALDLLKSMGLCRFRDGHILYTAGTTAGADCLLGIGYVAAADMPKPYAPVGSTAHYTVYENPYALPVGWTADAAMEQPVEAGDCFAYTQALFAAAAPEVDRQVYLPAAVTDTALAGLTAAGDGYAMGDAPTGSITYTVVPQADGPLYGVIDILDYPGVMVFVNGAYTAYYGTGQTNGTLYLGEHAAGEAVSVQIQTAVDLRMGDPPAFATEDIRAVAAYHDAMAGGGCMLTKLSDSHFTGSFTTGTGDSLLVLTIPYDRGWHVALDGEDVPVEQAQDCFIAIPVTEGTHILEMRYTPPGLMAGLCVSAAAAAVCAGVWLLQKKKKAAVRP